MCCMYCTQYQLILLVDDKNIKSIEYSNFSIKTFRLITNKYNAFYFYLCQTIHELSCTLICIRTQVNAKALEEIAGRYHCLVNHSVYLLFLYTYYIFHHQLLYTLYLHTNKHNTRMCDCTSLLLYYYYNICSIYYTYLRC